MPEDPVPSREMVPPMQAELALDLTSEAVRLCARDGSAWDGSARDGGAWVELGRVPLDADDFRAGIDALRRTADERGSPPVTIWLPPEQVLVRRYVLGRSGLDQREALQRIAKDTGHRAAELLVALSPAGEGELVTVLATFRRTAEQALGYSRRWGFRPAAVSTQVAAERFGGASPLFAAPEPGPRRFAGWQAAAAAVGVLAVGLGAWAAQDLVPDGAPDVTVAEAPASAMVATRESGRPVDGAAASAEGTPAAGFDGSASRLAEAVRTDPPLTADPEAAQTAGGPPDRQAGAGAIASLDAAAAAGAPAQSGQDESGVSRQSPDRQRAPAAPEPAADVEPLMNGIERIRAEQPVDAEDDILLAASEMAPKRVSGRPAPRPATSESAATEPEQAETEGSDTPAFDADSASRLAAPSAPRPAARPVLAYRPGSALPGAGSAAGQAGLTLDSTSLIGVIDARTGREALLRMPSGDFRKVTRGDQVAGWRVNAIGQDTMRLTRGGESRTLLLVTR